MTLGSHQHTSGSTTPVAGSCWQHRCSYAHLTHTEHTHTCWCTDIWPGHCRYILLATLISLTTHKKMHTHKKYRCSHCPTSCPWPSDQDREDKGTERLQERELSRCQHWQVCVLYVCVRDVWVSACMRAGQIMARFQHAALPLTQIRSSYLCLTLTASDVCIFSMHYVRPHLQTHQKHRPGEKP